MSESGPDAPDEDPDEPRGTLRPTSARALTASIVVGLALGWAIHPVMTSVAGRPPLVSWAQALVLVMVAAIMGFLAWHTWQTVQVRGQRLEPHQAVNRLVLGRAGALVGALAAGGYAGYAVSWIGDPAELAGQRILRCAVAVVAGVLTVVGALLLERACRVRKDPKDP